MRSRGFFLVLALVAGTLVMATPAAASARPSATPHTTSNGYWLVGSDGGIFNYGSAGFYGSTGSMVLQRPVVGMVTTPGGTGYWLTASDGGVFSFGQTKFYGSLPGLGFKPFGSGLPNALVLPVVGMVPSYDDNGYFMVAADGGIFAFGDAKFEGSCYDIGGCTQNGLAVAVMPDATGNGYWVVSSLGSVYGFGDAPYLGGPPPSFGSVVSAVATPDGKGYVILASNGALYGLGDAPFTGEMPAGPLSAANGGAAAVMLDAQNNGGWVAYADGKVIPFGSAPYSGDASNLPLNGKIVAGSGF
ncbi:MAG TPA: hypothetical protein VGG09_15995 [Acidimicrobiales bacterium]|jgi:hypothetical protein